METRCEYCGGRVPLDCDGVQVLGPDPFQEEIRGDYSDYLLCEGERHQSAMEI